MNKLKSLKVFLFVLIFLLSNSYTMARQDKHIVTEAGGYGRFPLVNDIAVPLIVDDAVDEGVMIAAKNFQKDIKAVTGKETDLIRSSSIPESQNMVIIGTFGTGGLIDQLVASGKLKVSGIAGRWETFVVETIEEPFVGVEQALVIAGSDKRGTIFGIYEMSEQIGVSPWYWWADVPIKKKTRLFVEHTRYSLGSPAVKYRGIFINDEAPALAGWAIEKFGGFNHDFYKKVYELILRLKGNFLWPAMWGRSLYDDDPMNAELADQYGVVISTSHHEPLMRAHVEWSRYGKGDWNYKTNAEELQQFWRTGIKRMGENESIVTLGMRGDGDEPMSEESNIALLEKIVKDQRKIIQEVTQKPIETTPQVWALYKEVQEYYDKGMRVPDDVTLLLCDDNWGNVRKLPEIGKEQHAGGYGMYYHFDYVGGPRNYKWLNTSQISRVWEQMHLTYEHGVDRIWVVNVGDIKPMELPISFFLDYAWRPEEWPAERLPEYTVQWVRDQFGVGLENEIADILELYTQFNSRRKPEMLDQHTYSLTHYQEAEQVVKDYKGLANRAQQIYDQLEPSYQAAYFQLVLFPVLACSNLNEMYLATAKNHLYAEQGHVLTNQMAQEVESLFKKDAALTMDYHELLDGKWNHMMDQTHIGYTYWQQPEKNAMPTVKNISIPKTGSLGVTASGIAAFYPDSKSLALPTISPYQTYNAFINLFNRGQSAVSYEIVKKPAWLSLSEENGTFKEKEQLEVSIDWESLDLGKHEGEIVLQSASESVTIKLPVHKFQVPDDFTGFIESGGYISMEAPHFTNQKVVSPVKWQVIPGLGKTGDGLTAFPVSYKIEKVERPRNYVEYKAYFTSKGPINIYTYLSPTLNFKNTEEGLRLGISVDDEAPQILYLHHGENGYMWNKWVGENINIQTSKHVIDAPGEHSVKIWLIDPAVVIQKIVIDTGGLNESYLGPEESFMHFSKSNP
ncbi:glycosyl hydrolase 115 family protein [Echinicola sp. CAU 1574]|uniref:Glycosyl hydrolase 115 family protein n=1 Tax=Echinicola arenosa TaxID=2774144 RepID=A0ABR9AK80_9BACT|nr:glycosyl hydrolase 115 family protein [Echinicola arenosa]MBD8488014.1 glycosyl hydrolase 115 family protein [Echinicola arenosa]